MTNLSNFLYQINNMKQIIFSILKIFIILFATIFVFVTFFIKILTQILIIPFKFVTNRLVENVLEIVENRRKYLENNNNFGQTDVIRCLVEIDKDILFLKNLNKYIQKYF